jgi:hypothetical protein
LTGLSQIKIRSIEAGETGSLSDSACIRNGRGASPVLVGDSGTVKPAGRLPPFEFVFVFMVASEFAFEFALEFAFEFALGLQLKMGIELGAASALLLSPAFNVPPRDVRRAPPPTAKIPPLPLLTPDDIRIDVAAYLACLEALFMRSSDILEISDILETSDILDAPETFVPDLRYDPLVLALLIVACK